MLVRTTSGDNNDYERYLVAPTLTAFNFLCTGLYICASIYLRRTLCGQALYHHHRIVSL